eukprot:TRINITY_DN2924_c0_g1_i4.p1 TRINITY_DN2924_c0_g1~~TRINITY_DN2924_c0_g1_i4.p1  ORF type:complete len:160 (+),score=15.53 TRINITY_DN2924_c0_g1_i4:106-585(+)
MDRNLYPLFNPIRQPTQTNRKEKFIQYFYEHLSIRIPNFNDWLSLIVNQKFYEKQFLKRLRKSICVYRSHFIGKLFDTLHLYLQLLLQENVFFCVSPVSYTHLTLPTILLVQISVVAVSLKKKKHRARTSAGEKKTRHTYKRRQRRDGATVLTAHSRRD